MTAAAVKNALIIGASRGLGYALAAEYLSRGWQVTATVRGTGTQLHDLAASSAGRTPSLRPRRRFVPCRARRRRR